MTTNARPFTGGNFMLDVGGYNVGYLKKFSGLQMEADIVTNDLGPENIQKKHVANIKWSPGKATIGMGMGKGMYDWIRASFDRNYVKKHGMLTTADFNGKAQNYAEFHDALITSVTVPKLDGLSKDAAYFDVEFDAERVRWSKGGGEKIKGDIGSKQKAWLCSCFRVEIGGLPSNGVSTVDSFTWKCSVATDAVGIYKEHTKHPAKVTVPDLKFGISYVDHQAWAEAARKWFIDGQHEENDEMTGRIVFLGPDKTSELGAIELMGLGFKKFSDEDAEANSEKTKRFNVELYCEAMRFNMRYTDA